MMLATAVQWAADPAEFASLTDYSGPSTIEVTAPSRQEEADRQELGYRVAEALDAEATEAEWAEIEEALADDEAVDFA